MHHEHREWKSELVMWFEDIDVWQRQLKEALRRHTEHAEKIGPLLEALATERSQLRIIQDVMDQHEHKMANADHFGDSLPEWMTLKHLDIAKEMEKWRAHHAKLRVQHREQIACLEPGGADPQA